MMLQRCLFEQEYAAAQIRGRINEYIDRLMEHEARVRKAWSRNGAIRCTEGERACYTDDVTGTRYRDAGNYVYACALECALLDAPAFGMWWSHNNIQEQTGGMIDIILGFAWQDADDPDHRWWRDAIEDLVRKTETLIGDMPPHARMHHRDFAMHVRRHVAPVRQGV